MKIKEGLAQRLYTPIVFLVVVAAIFFGVAVFTKADSPAVQQKKADRLLQPFSIDAAIPNAQVYKSNGDKVALESQLPTTTLVTFWSAFCGECQAGLTDIQKFADQNPDFSVTLVSYKNSPKDGEDFLGKNKITLPSLYDVDGTAFTAWSSTMPASYFIKNHRIIFFFPGRISTDHLKALLAQSN